MFFALASALSAVVGSRGGTTALTLTRSRFDMSTSFPSGREEQPGDAAHALLGNARLLFNDGYLPSIVL